MAPCFNTIAVAFAKKLMPKLPRIRWSGMSELLWSSDKAKGPGKKSSAAGSAEEAAHPWLVKVKIESTKQLLV